MQVVVDDDDDVYEGLSTMICMCGCVGIDRREKETRNGGDPQKR